jgi:hypothetical protein
MKPEGTEEVAVAYFNALFQKHKQLAPSPSRSASQDNITVRYITIKGKVVPVRN